MRSSIGFYVSFRCGENERVIEEAGFQLLRVEDTTANTAAVAKRWHDARARRENILVPIEGRENFDGLQGFLSCVYTLAGERRLSRFLYLAGKSSRPEETRPRRHPYARCHGGCKIDGSRNIAGRAAVHALPARLEGTLRRMTPNTVECPHCHSTNPATASFCQNCKAPFGADDVTMGIAAPRVTPPGAKAPSPPPPSAPSDPSMDVTAPMISPAGAARGSTSGWQSGVTTPATGVPTGWSLPNAGYVVNAAPIVPGSVLGTRYEIISLLGQGGMGAVYKAKDRELERLVALKVIRPELAVEPETLHRFKQELILARQITHKNVIRIFDLGESDGIKFITMEFIEGEDLKSLITGGGKLPYDETVRIMEQVCYALEAAHGEGVVHRDLKPQNIMIDKSGKAAVMDFGIARSIEPGATDHDANRHARGHAGLHVARAGDGRESGCAFRSFHFRRNSLRAAHRRDALQGRFRAGHNVQAHARSRQAAYRS